MTDAPERIWADSRTCTVDGSGAARLLAMDREFHRAAEYIRADLHQQALAAAREEGRRAGVKEAMRVARVHNLGRDYECSQRQIDAIHALIDKPGDAQKEGECETETVAASKN